MTEYVRRYVPCRNPLCWNVVFVWDGPLCSSACKAAWCHANARNPTNGLINPPIVHAAGDGIPLEVEQAVTAQIDHRAAALQAALSPLAAVVECEPMPGVTVQPAWFAGAPKFDPTPRPGYVKRWLRGWFG